MPRLSKVRKELLTTMMKDSIFEATTSVLSEHGIDGMTMNRVAEAADLAKSSLYDYFQNKDELLQFVAHRIMAPIADRTEEIAQADLPATEKLRGVIRAALSGVELHRALLVLLVRDKFRHGPDAVGQSVRERVARTVTTVFEQGMREGQIRRDDPAQLARLFLACVGEFCEIWIAADPPEEIEHCVEKVLRIFLHGVTVDAASASGRRGDK
jgi:AcrR family transcriptional regulator